MFAMAYQNILTEIDGELLVVTLHRPGKLNAMTHQMRIDLMNCVHQAEEDDAVRAIVFTGHGDKAFCAGANIPELAGRTVASEMGNAGRQPFGIDRVHFFPITRPHTFDGGIYRQN
jgi:enoyl-CoA hydratase/carnithine racemase